MRWGVGGGTFSAVTGLPITRFRKAAVVMCVAALATTALAKKKSEPVEIPWMENVPHAVAEAGRTGKPVLVDVWATWCAPCKMMEETTYRDAEVREAIQNFVPLKVDADLQQLFIQRYRINAYPTVLVLDADGEEITRLLGLIEAPVMLESLEKIHAGYEDFLSAKKSGDHPPSLVTMGEYLLESRNPRGAADVLRRSIRLLKNAEPAEIHRTEILLAEALLKAGSDKQAAKTFERLVEEAEDDEVRARAMAGMVTVNRRRGLDKEADALLEQLRAEHPAIAERLK